MKVGTLVRWTHPEDLSIGIVLSKRLGMLAIKWFGKEGCGYYPSSHELMEIISEP